MARFLLVPLLGLLVTLLMGKAPNFGVFATSADMETNEEGILARDSEAQRDACAFEAELARRHSIVWGGAIWDGNNSDGTPFFSFVKGDSKDAVAHGVYIDSANTDSNFGKLRIVTDSGWPDEVQMAAAGWLEGWMTAERVYDHFVNTKHYFVNQLYPGFDLNESMGWLYDQQDWLSKEINSNKATDGRLRVAGLVAAQFEGLIAGYQARAEHEKSEAAARQFHMRGTASFMLPSLDHTSVGELSRDDLVFLQNNGELYDIIDSMQAQKQSPPESGDDYNIDDSDDDDDGDGYDADSDSNINANRKKKQHRQKYDKRFHNRLDPDTDDPRILLRDIALRGKCTGLIKVAGDLSDIFIGHSTWDTYTAALRIYKMYDFTGLSDPAVVGHKLSFSSYPGEIFSDDDFYITDAGLVVLETTNHIFDLDILAKLSIKSLPSWIRVRTANMISANGSMWVDMFKASNSGTYNNQYMVLDLNKFVPKLAMEKGMLWVAEQVPGQVFAADVTDELARGYWPSYNVPYFDEVYNLTGYNKMVEKYSYKDYKEFGLPVQWLKYNIAPRANIFRRDQGKIEDIRNMRDMMRMNAYETDKYSFGNALAAVCGRGDLNDEDIAVPRGCYDSKITTYKLAIHLEAEVVNGPTPTQTGTNFVWTRKWKDYKHQGHPTEFKFVFERMTAVDLPIKMCHGHNASYGHSEI